MNWYSELAGLQHKVGSRPVLLVCDSAFDQEWAVFFLRHVNLKVPEYFGYLGALKSLMHRAKFTSEPPAFLLVSELIEGAVWTNQRFSLLELASEPKLIGIQAPNALEHVNGRPFVWLGKNATRFLGKFPLGASSVSSRTPIICFSSSKTDRTPGRRKRWTSKLT